MKVSDFFKVGKLQAFGTVFILFLLLFSTPNQAFADGKEFLKNCEIAATYLEGNNMASFPDARVEDFITCPAYIEGFMELNYQYQGMLGKNALFCLPQKKLDKMEGTRVVLEFMRTHETELSEEKDYLVSAAFSTKYPCIPLMKKKK